MVPARTLLAALALSLVPSTRVKDPVDLSALGVDELLLLLPRLEDEAPFDPETITWITDPAVLELETRLVTGGELSDEQWARALRGSGALRVRERWPAGVPFAASLRVPQWLRSTEIEVTPQGLGLGGARADATYRESCRVGLGAFEPEPLEWYQVLGSLPSGKHRVVCDVRVDRDVDSWFRRGISRIWSGELAFDVEVVASVDDVVIPVAGFEIDSAVRASTSLEFAGGISRRAFLRVERDVAAYHVLDGVALSLDVELVWRGETLATGSVIYPDPEVLQPWFEPGVAPFTRLALPELPPECETDPAAREGWVLRLCGTSRDVLGVWECDARWIGDVEIPLAEAIERGRFSR